jgi:SpoIID/LytB domain protein
VTSLRSRDRLLAAATAAAAVTAVLVVPVMTGPSAEVHPVTPSVATLALSGIDAAALAASPAPSHDDEHHAEDLAVTGSVTAGGVAEAVSVPAPAAPHADEPAAPEAPLKPAAVTKPTDTEPFTLVGVDWKGAAPAGTVVQVRVRNDGTWSDWQTLEVDAEHGPDPGSEEAQHVRTGTDPLLVEAGSDGVQVRVDTPGGVLPTDAQVSLVDPKQSEADALVSPTPLSTAAAAGDPLKPAIITRAQWGADESLRSRGPVYTGTIRAGFLHHTASSTSYAKEQAAAQVRALYAYFTLSLGYSDIAYNFFVDRFGRLYEGRAGGMDRNVLGGHTAGFNENTFAVAAIGDFDTTKPNATDYAAIQESVSKLFAWKFALNHADPTGTATLTSNSSAGTSKYSSGTTVTVPAVMGHRDIGSTACPGRYLEPMVPNIRTRAKALMGAQLLAPSLSPSVPAYGSSGTSLTTRTTAPVSWRLDIYSPCQDNAIRSVTGTTSAAGTLKVSWDLRTSGGYRARPAAYRMVLSASKGSQVAYPVSRTVVIGDSATSPLGPCSTVQRIGSSDRYTAAVQAARIAAPTSRTVVLTSGADAALPEALIAAPLASVKGAAQMLVTSSSLPAVVSADIQARKATTAYIVGSTTQITTTVDAQLKRLGVTSVVRLAGADRAATAAAVAKATGVKGTAVVVSFDAAASRDLATAAAATAASVRKPLLVVTATKVPAATATAISDLRISSTTVVGGTATISETVRAAVKGVRTSASTDAATSEALVAKLATSATAVTALPVGSGYGRAVSASLRRPVVLGAGGTAGIALWLAGSVAAQAVAVAPTSTWSDTSLGALARAVAPASTGTGSTPTPTPTPTPAPAPAGPAIPASFVFNGAGFGHGVGMPQYGAYGMAVDGSTAEEIVTHYYSGTTVAPVDDRANIRVNLLSRRTTAVFRSEALATGGGAIKVTVTNTVNGVKSTVASFVGGTSDTFALKAAGAGKVTLTRTRGTTTTTVGTGTGVQVNWEGTRYAGTLGASATALNVATSTAGLATSGHRYRYGYLLVGSTTASPSTFEVVNALRVGDEYLLGIGEVPSSWPAAALQAQVLAARSYALVKNRTLRAACLCNVDDGGGPYYDQTFVGWSKESGTGGAAWRAAVNATLHTTTSGTTSVTKGDAILYNGAVIQAFYYASSGGRTQSSQEVWVATLPYLQSVSDPYSLRSAVPYSSWAPRERTQAQVASAFGLKDVVRIDLSSRTAGGGVKSAVAYSSAGATATLTGESLRTRLSLPATWVWRAVETRSGDAPTIAAAVAARSSASDVVLAPSNSPVMVAVASSLAGQKGWPLLLTSPSSATAATTAELKRRGALRATTVHAVGTEANLSAATLASLDAIPGVTVARVTGADSSAVSVAAAQLVGYAPGRPAVVVARTDATSAASASGMAAGLGRPLLVVPGGAATSDVVAAYLADELKPASTTVVGTTTAVDDTVLAALPSATRIAGYDASSTAARVASAMGASLTRRVALSTADATGVITAMASAPGAPVIVIGTSVSATTKVVLQRGTHTVVTNPTIAAALLTAVRRA